MFAKWAYLEDQWVELKLSNSKRFHVLGAEISDSLFFTIVVINLLNVLCYQRGKSIIGRRYGGFDGYLWSAGR